jgi:hypothetical protein
MAGGPVYDTTNNCCASCGDIDTVAWDNPGPGSDNTNWPIDIKITANDADLPITWCGITWVKSTTTPGANQIQSGDIARVCPTRYIELANAQTWKPTASHHWDFVGAGIDFKLQANQFTYISYYNRIYLGTIAKDNQRWYPSGTLYSSTYEIGLLTGYARADAYGQWTIQPGFFGSHTVTGVGGNVTYTWSRESAGITWP